MRGMYVINFGRAEARRRTNSSQICRIQRCYTIKSNRHYYKYKGGGALGNKKNQFHSNFSWPLTLSLYTHNQHEREREREREREIMSTLTVPPVPPSPRDDAVQLHRAFKGFGCDTEAVINIIAHRDATQRALIQHEYKYMYSEDLFKRLTSELRGKLEIAVLCWMHDPAGRDATILQQELSSDSANLQSVTEVLCSRTPSQIYTLKQIYHSMFGVYLENDIEQQTSGDHKKILLAYITTPRSEGFEVDREMVERDAKALFKAGEKKLGTDEKTFIRIFSERSRAHLVAIDSSYRNMYGNSLKKAVKSETSGKFELALLTILQCAHNPAKYFAKVLHKAMKGLGTDDITLIRVVVTRTEIDMQYIKAEYQKKYRKSLNDAVHSETSGHYRSFLLSLLGPNH